MISGVSVLCDVVTLLVGSSCRLSAIAILFLQAVTSCVISSISRDT